MTTTSRRSGDDRDDRGPAVDLFAVPHSRMKELVNRHLKQVPEIEDFENVSLLETLLQSVYQAMWELKSHEYIENYFIMDRLKARLQAQQVYNKLVCNCHEDSKLLGVIRLVENVYNAQSDTERLEQGRLLQDAVRDFLDEFLHHMDEEEAIFQPLLNKYFELSELMSLRAQVLEQHKLWKEKVKSEKSLKTLKRKCNEEVFDNLDVSLDDLRFRKSYCQEVNDFFGISSPAPPIEAPPTPSASSSNSSQVPAEEPTAPAPILRLPDEIMVHVFRFMNPRQLVTCSAVCRHWNRLAYTPSLWQQLYPSQWARGQWTFDYEDPLDGLLNYSPSSSLDDDDDGDSSGDEQSSTSTAPGCISARERLQEGRVYAGILNCLLPKVGQAVTRLVMSASRCSVSHLIRSMLIKLPNVRHIDLSYTSVNDLAFKGLAKEKCLRKLQHLDLSGCREITDMSLERIASCFFKTRNTTQSQIRFISLSGCYRVTTAGLERLSVHQESLQSLDLSGLYKINGEALATFVENCPKLKPEELFYCSNIQNGPHQKYANGCQNLDCPIRACCQKMGN